MSNEWISVDDRLPELNKSRGDTKMSDNMLVVSNTGSMDVAYYSYQSGNLANGWKVHHYEGLYGKVTHWMNLPSAPVSNNNEDDDE